MTGKIAGIPFVLLILVLLIIAPLGYGLLLVSNQVTDLKQTVVNFNAATIVPLPTVEPTASPSATPSPVKTLKVVLPTKSLK